jgi:cholesterol transport system auxiliary component
MKIRIPNIEVRNKHEPANDPMIQTRPCTRNRPGVLGFRHLDLFRISSFVLGVSLCLVALAGCSSSPLANKLQYMLNPGRPQQVADQPTQRVLEVDRFTIETAFATTSLVYRTGALQYQSDFYNEFLVGPAVMITEETRDWLSRTGLFVRVSGSASRTAPTHLLEGNIVELYGDLRDKKAPAAVVQIRCFFSQLDPQGHPTLIFARDYSASCPLESRDARGLVDAYSRCFQQILSALQKDLTDRL